MKDYITSLGLPEEAAAGILARHEEVVAGFAQQLRNQAVDAAVKQAVSAAGGRNLTAIRALLEESAFGEDPEADARAAVARVKRENPYLFLGPVSAPGTGTPIPRDLTNRDLEKMSLAEYRAYGTRN
jgi:hypothetical protein